MREWGLGRAAENAPLGKDASPPVCGGAEACRYLCALSTTHYSDKCRSTTRHYIRMTDEEKFAARAVLAGAPYVAALGLAFRMKLIGCI